MGHFPYSIPEQRPLTSEEQELLRALLTTTAPGRLPELSKLTVQARCGCGRCPTIMFEEHPEQNGAPKLVADFKGGTEGTVGIMLWTRQGRLSELEAWSLDGDGVGAWPAIETVTPFVVGEEPDKP